MDSVDKSTVFSRNIFIQIDAVYPTFLNVMLPPTVSIFFFEKYQNFESPCHDTSRDDVSGRASVYNLLL